MRVLEVGGGSGRIAVTLAKHWNTQVVTLEPWTDGNDIETLASQEGVANQVLALRVKAQALPFPDNSFDAVVSVGSFEMIGEERPRALQEIIRVVRPGACFGIAEPMCYSDMPDELVKLDDHYGLNFRQCFRTLEWNKRLFEDHGLEVVESYYFPEAYKWWVEYSDQGRISAGEQGFISCDQGRWISLGLVVGRKIT
jgi:ubiquinone/menaquinone biosynthesis C-methylase UbiE